MTSDAGSGNGEDREDTLEERLPGYRYGLVLFLLLTTFVFWSAASTSWIHTVTVALQGLTLAAALYSSGASRRTVFAAVVFAALATVGSAVAGTENRTVGSFSLLSAALVTIAPLAIVRGIRSRGGRIDMHTVLGALCVYVLIGMIFAFAFDAIARLSGDPFFVGRQQATGAEYLYFSFTALTTTGFGDFVAAGALGRAIVVLEELLGQLYLVTVVAVLVANVGRSRGATS